MNRLDRTLVVVLAVLAGVPMIAAAGVSGSVDIPAAKIYRGPTYSTPPPRPKGAEQPREEQEREGQLAPPLQRDAVQIAPTQRVETRTGGRAPNTFTILRNTALSPGSSGGVSSSVNEPSLGSLGLSQFVSHNWFAARSTDNGVSWSYLSPYTTFPNSPAAFSAGFCCDQRVMQVPDRELIVWYLQYLKTATSGGVRLAVARGANALATNTWATYDFTPADLGLTNVWYDFPHLQVSANFLYFTTNIFTSADAFNGAVIYRMPLAALANGQAFTANTFYTQAYGSIGPVNGAGAIGSRPGRTTMYFASVTSSTALRVLTWPEANVTPTEATVSGLSSTTFGANTCTAPDGTNPCGRSNSRIQTGWIVDGELGFMWPSAQNVAASRPFPFVRTVLLNPSTLAVLGQPDLFSSTSAFLYPAISVNARGHLGGVVANLGGNVNGSIRALIRDDLSPSVATNGWETFEAQAGSNGTASRWGDYLGSVPHSRFPQTWLTSGHIQSGGTGNTNSRTHVVWFARERDALPALTVTRSGVGAANGSVTSAPSGINCGNACSASYGLGSTVTLTASTTGFSRFAGWSGPCSGLGTCVVTLNEATSVQANFVLEQFALSVSRTGTGTGTLASTPAGISCGVTCSANFDANTVVSLTASPSANAIFDGFSGACSGTTNPCQVTMSAARSVTAQFTAAQPNFSLELSDGRAFTQIGATSYTLTARNTGNLGATGLTLSTTPPALLSAVSYSFSATPTGCASAASGSGAINTTIALPAGCELRATINATVLAGPGDQLNFPAQLVVPNAPTMNASDFTQVVIFRNGLDP